MKNRGLSEKNITLRASEFKDAVIAITYQCNARCTMCNIWQYKGPAPLAAEEYLKVPKSLEMVNISGGECFLRSDIAQVMNNIKVAAPKTKFKISTNAFATELTRKRFKEILEVIPKKDIGITISVDGYADKHDEIRRIPEGYKKVMATLQMFKDEGISDLTIAATIGDYNLEGLMKLYEESKRLDAQFTVAVVHNSEHYFQIEDNKIDRTDEVKAEFMKLVRAELKTWNLKRWVRAFFAYGVVHYLTFSERILPNYGGRKAFFLDPNGFVHASDVAPKPMGNIKDYDTFQELLDTDEAKRQAYKESQSPNWMICTARTAIQTHPIRVVAWILKNKFIPGTLTTPQNIEKKNVTVSPNTV